MATTGLPLERSVDLRWMPKDCDGGWCKSCWGDPICLSTGQIKMGFNIIANAFKSKVKALEEDLRAANEERSELDEKVSFSRSEQNIILLVFSLLPCTKS